MFRNYDGNKATFGDTSVSASGPNPDNVACFAARRSTDGALTVLAINKQLTAAATVNVSLANFLPSGTAQVWQLAAANTIAHLSDVTFTGGAFSNTLPAQSISLFVLPAGTAAKVASHRADGEQHLRPPPQRPERPALRDPFEQQFCELGSGADEYAGRQFTTAHAPSFHHHPLLPRPVAAVNRCQLF